MNAAELPAIAPEHSRVDLVLIGARGRVGSAVRQRLAERGHALQAQLGLDLRLRAALDSRGLAHHAAGLDPLALEDQLAARSAGDLERLCRTLQPATVLIDCTASDEIAGHYPDWLAQGFAVAGANKHAGARPLAFYRALHGSSGRRAWHYETTVGAAIPILGPLRDLRLRGERVLGIRGLLSGSLSYLLARLQHGSDFAEAVLEARALGYTEPNPLDDLSGQDIARKLLILGREAGFDLEPEQIDIEPLSRIPRAIGERDEAGLIAALCAENEAWAQQVQQAKSRRLQLVMVGEVGPQGGRVSLQALPADDILASARPGENVVEIRTELQQQPPLTLRGPGAGAEITAAGVFSDVVAAAQAFTR